MLAKRLFATLCFCALAATVIDVARAQSSPSTLDEARSGWRYRRAVSVKDGAGLATIDLPPDVRAESAGDLRDLRLLRADNGQEVPYIVEEQAPIREEKRTSGELIDTRVERREQTIWLIDLKRVRSFASIFLRIDEREFAKRLKIESATGRDGPFRVLDGDFGAFDRVWPWYDDWRLHHTELALPAPVQARYLRITADDRKSLPVHLSGAEVRLVQNAPGLEWSRAATLSPLPNATKSLPAKSSYHLNLPAGYPLESLELATDDAIFARRVAIREQDSDGKLETLGEGLLFRFFPFMTVKRRIEEMANQKSEEPAAEERRLRLSRHPGPGTVIVEIEDGDSPPLRNVRAVVFGAATRLVVPLHAETGKPGTTLWLYYGNARARSPQYDLESLKGRLSGLAGLPALQLAEQQDNPRFRTQPPLSFVASVGAPLSVQDYRALRRLRLPAGKGEDIYGCSLLAEDLGLLRPDFADLRIVDGNDRQVPYVLSPAESERELLMTARSEPSARVSRFVLELPKVLQTQNGQGASLPIAAVDIEVKDSLFTRPVRLLAPSLDRQGEERQIFSGQISRQQPADADDSDAATTNAPAVVRLTLGSDRYRALALEIDNQDNAPLRIERVSAIIAVPKVAFKLKPEGEYRLLYGAPEAESPHYDIELLRRAVFDYAAVPVELGEVEANPGYRARVADYVREAPPTLVIWTALGLGIVVLLGLTIRLLKKKEENA